jgi:serine phosphatase RsbU (regulator of sigma subunit)
MKFLRLPITWIPPKAIQWLYVSTSVIIIILACVSLYRVLFVTPQSNDQCIWLDSSWLDRSKPKGILIITRVVSGGVTSNAGIINGDSLLAINGNYNLTSDKATRIINALKNGDFAYYTIKRGSKVFTTPVMMVKTYNTYFIGLILTSLCFLVVGTLVVVRKPHGELQQWFGLYSMITALAFWFFSNDGWINGYLNIPIAVFGGIAFIISMLLPFQMYFYDQFPIKKKISKKNIYTTYGIVIGVYALIFFLINFSEVGQKDPSNQFIRLLQVTYTFYYPIGLTMFIFRFFELPVSERKQFRGVVIANGICVVLLTYLLFITLTNSSAQFLNPYLLAPALLICLPPFALGYAIFRYGLMDVDIIIERSLIFTVVASIIALLYVGVIFATSEFMLGFMQGLLGVRVNNSLVTFIALCVITLLFEPIKRRVEHSVERLLYQDRVNYQQALLALSKELPGMIRFDEITRTLSTRLRETMRIDSVKIMVSEDYYAHYEQHSDSPSKTNTKESSTTQIALAEKETTQQESTSKNQTIVLPELEETSDSIFGTLQSTKNALRIEKKSSPKNNFEREMNSLAELGYQLAVPLLGSEVILGIIFCSKKLSGKAYSQDDVDLLSTVASQAAIAYENARLHTSEIERGKMQESLQVARRIQQNLLPTTMPIIDGVSISCASEQAEVVGGDFYDVVELADKSVLVAVGDVSGKGMSAALYMAQIQGMIRISAGMHSSPKDMLIAVNQHLYERMDRQTYVTLCLVKINPAEKKITVCRAGHTKPIICLDNQPAHPLESKGLGAGLTSNLRFAPTLEEVHIEWKDTCTILLYSDGVNETPDIYGNELGVDRITRIVNEISSGKYGIETSLRLQERIMQEVLDVRAEQQPFDDSTIVAVHCTNTVSELAEIG